MTIRCGVVGMRRGKLFAEAFDEIPNCQTTAVCDLNPALLAPYSGIQTFTNFEEFIRRAEIDVVAVVTPGPAHVEHTLRALEAGKHVICETPCVQSLEEAHRLVETVKKTGLKFMLAEDYIWHGWMEQCRELVDAGKLGEIVYAEGEYTHDCRNIMLMKPDGQYVRYDRRHEYENLTLSWRATHLPPIHYCSHTLGPILNVMRDRCVAALGLHTGTRTAPDLGTIDMEVGIFKTVAGRVIRLTNGFSIAHPMALVYNFCGTRGSLRLLRTADMQGKFYSEVNGTSGWQDLKFGWSRRKDGREGMQVMLADFIEAVRHDTKPPLDVYESLDCILPGICAHLSAEKGGELVQVPDFRTCSGPSTIALLSSEQPTRVHPPGGRSG